MAKLIILRGPSASGKSTIAKKIVKSNSKDTALLDFDVYRLDFLNKKGDYYPTSAKMLMSDTIIALRADYDVVIDGFYRLENYPDLFEELLREHENENYMFYFDISLEETIHRHKGRPKADLYGEKELTEWYHTPKPNNNYKFEYKIKESSTIQETFDFIKNIAKL